uniref:Retinoblastoma-associated protein A-box domain-containing protein n=1 Tax=Haptolina ericina TaxID=156174 RepID=A0A7S3BBY4_9EUKA
MAAVAYLTNLKASSPGFSIARVLQHLSVPMKEFLQSVQEQNACLSPGASLPPEFQQLKAQYVVSTIAFTKWKTFFPKLFPMGFVASDGVHSEETQTSFQLGWLIFLIAKTTLLANKGDVMQSYHLLACVTHFLIAHLPESAQKSTIWSDVEGEVPAECYPLPQHAQTRLWKMMLARPEEVELQQAGFGAFISHLRPLFELDDAPATAEVDGAGGEGVKGLFSYAPLSSTLQKVKDKYNEIWVEHSPIDEQHFLEQPARAPQSAPASPNRQTTASSAQAQLLTPLRQGVSLSVYQMNTPFSSQLESVGWLMEATQVDSEALLVRFFDACTQNPQQIITERLARLSGRVKSHLLATDPTCDAIEERCMLAQRLYHKMLLAFLQAEEDRLKKSDFTALLSKEEFHCSLFACCMEGVFASYSMQEMAFPAIIEVLEIHAFDFGKVIESFVKHEEQLPAHLKQHFVQVEHKVIESLAWQDGSPLHALMMEYEAAHSNGEPLQPSRVHKALQQFLKKCLFVAATRIQDICVRLLLPQSLVQQVWECVKVVLESVRTLLRGRHLDQIIMCSVYGVCKVNQRPVTFRHIIDKYKLQASATPKVFREVCMATAEEEPQDIIKFYNVIYIPAMKDHLLRVCTANAEGASTPVLHSAGSPHRVSSQADVYVSQRRAAEPSMTPRTMKLYAFSDTPAHTSSDGLKHINHQLNAGNSDAANALQALSSSMSPPQSSGPQKRGLNLSHGGDGRGVRQVMQRRLAELGAVERSSSSPVSSASDAQEG